MAESLECRKRGLEFEKFRESRKCNRGKFSVIRSRKKRRC